MPSAWTAERRAKQAELIRTWKPWQQSTGPITTEGKAVVASNAWRGGQRNMLRILTRMVNAKIRESKEIEETLQNFT
jgi:hypothetical protein